MASRRCCSAARERGMRCPPAPSVANTQGNSHQTKSSSQSSLLCRAPLVQELVARGEEIVYYASDAFGPSITQADARYRAYRNAFLADLIGLPERLHELSWLLMRTTAEVLAEHLAAFRTERPDYLITDSVAPWGQWAAEILGVPVVTSVSTFAFNRRVLAFAAAHGI